MSRPASAQASATQAPPPPEDEQMPTRLPAGRRLPMVDERRRDIDHLVEIVALDHAVAARTARGTRHRRRAPRYATRSARAPGFGRAELVDDQRLAGAQRLLGDALEGRDVLDVLDQHQDDVGLAFVDDELGEVARFEAGFVAGGHDVAERQLLRPAVIEEREAHAAALRDHRDLPARALRRAAAAARRPASIAGLKVGHSAAAVLAKPSPFGPLTAMS